MSCLITMSRKDCIVLHATKAYLQQWGKPLGFSANKHGAFRSTHASQKDRTSGLTQFGRALYELNIDIICANTPQVFSTG
ncbi:hypothetical protein FHT86_007012 [Rhizobium sp. BK313]|jgi:hypothetical protein|nr:hypothetical protein [Rhizobium sp. BK313]